MFNQTSGDISKYFPFLLTLAPLFIFFQQTKSFLLRVFGFFWKSKSVPYDFGAKLYFSLRNKSLILDFDNHDISNCTYYSIKHNEYINMLIKNNSFEVLLYKHFIPIFVSGVAGNKIKFSYLKYTFNFEKHITMVVHDELREGNKSIISRQFYMKEIRGRDMKDAFRASENRNSVQPPSAVSSQPETLEKYIVWPDKYLKYKISNKIYGYDINEVDYCPRIIKYKDRYQFTEQGSYVMNQVKKWLDAETWYSNKNIPWKRGCCLTSKPGMGKSQLILQIAQRLQLPLLIFDLQSMSNNEFEESLSTLTNDPAILLIEDIDNVWVGRENVVKNEKYPNISFDYFINKLSGVNTIRNKFIFITTNYLDKLDSALIRPGRCDELIELGCLNAEEKKELAIVLLDNNLDLINQVLIDGFNDSTAEFENRVIKIALNNYWNNDANKL